MKLLHWYFENELWENNLEKLLWLSWFILTDMYIGKVGISSKKDKSGRVNVNINYCIVNSKVLEIIGWLILKAAKHNGKVIVGQLTEWISRISGYYLFYCIKLLIKYLC